MTDPFPDWLSPIIVKELRQGLRSRGFVSLLSILQAAMVLCVFVTVESASNSVGSQASTAFFWMLAGGALLVGLPLAAVMSLSSEIKANTLELLSLTPLSAWRIAAGKWSALFLQGVLLTTTLLPYVVLRYFVGGLDLLREVSLLLLMLAGSGILLAVGVGLSPLAHRLVGRVLLGVGAIIAFNALPALFVGSGMFRGTSLPVGYWVAVILCLGPLIILEALEMGVAGIAPPGEDTTSRRRLLAVAIALVAGVLGVVWGERLASLILGSLLVAPVVLSSLMEKAPLIPTRYDAPRWTRGNGVLRKLAAVFLQPGLASAAAFSTLVVAILIFFSGYRFGDEKINIGLLFALGALVMPLAVARLLKGPAFAYFLAMQALGFVIFIYLTVFHRNTEVVELSGFLPTAAFLLYLSGSFTTSTAGTAPVAAVLAGGVTLLSIVVLAWLARCERREIAACRSEES